MYNLMAVYPMPQIVYADINTDINDPTYKTWKIEMELGGWKFKETCG